MIGNGSYLQDCTGIEKATVSALLYKLMAALPSKRRTIILDPLISADYHGVSLMEMLGKEGGTTVSGSLGGGLRNNLPHPLFKFVEGSICLRPILGWQNNLVSIAPFHLGLSYYITGRSRQSERQKSRWQHC
jgi:hypothetical protein